MVLMVLVIRRRPGESGAGILAGYMTKREGGYIIGGVLRVRQRRGEEGVSVWGLSERLEKRGEFDLL
jgi:hypothetical protein